MPPRPAWPAPGLASRTLSPRPRRQWPRAFRASTARFSIGDHLPSSQDTGAAERRDKSVSEEGEASNGERGPTTPEAGGRIGELEEKLRAARRDAAQYSNQLETLYGPRSRRQGRRGGRPVAAEAAAAAAAPVEIPAWFLERNVTLHADLEALRAKSLRELLAEGNEDIPLPPLPSGGSDLPTSSLDKYSYAELLFALAASFRLADANVTPSFFASKANIGLLTPVEGALPWLQSIVEHLAAHMQADIVRLDALDLMEMGSDILPKARPGDHPIRALSYEVYQEEPEEEYEDEEGEGGEDEVVEADAAPLRRDFMVVKDLRGSAARDVMNMFSGKKGMDLSAMLSGATPIRLGEGGIRLHSPDVMDSSVSVENSKIHVMLEAILEAALSASQQRAGNAGDAASAAEGLRDAGNQSETPIGNDLKSLAADLRTITRDTESFSSFMTSRIPGLLAKIVDTASPAPPQRLIVCVSDVTSLSHTTLGDRIFNTLTEIVRRRRAHGQQITIIGLSEGANEGTETAEAAQRQLDAQSRGSLFRVMLTVPDVEKPTRFRWTKNQLKTWAHDNKSQEASSKESLWDHINSSRKAFINLRHIGDMCKRLLPPGHTFSMPLSHEIPPELLSVLDSGRVLTPEEVHNIAMTVVGIRALSNNDSSHIDLSELIFATTILDESARSRHNWTPNEGKEAAKKESTKKGGVDSALLESIKKTANRYEKRLIGGVVSAAKISTTFDQVHVAKDTISALKTLTSLSLLRPDAFKYGVLKADAIPGLLLYGPPGTGKTLLAKAVAKESGASVLSISGADVNHMYVGESEKSVAAIFTLAKKLSPCVVFIDEADALFGSRSQARMRPSHRDTINQFLREWDGMDEGNVFLMVATNRPFDLDDAVLRRLPRRLLVDLPAQPDREAILRIHLRDEQLAPDVRPAALAEQTPFFSGSDLKNLAVAAALACVREENEGLASSLGDAGSGSPSSDAPAELPARRTLEARHFAAALDEISASVSEDMESLNAIRKFDEQYGDRKGRRKKNPYGFNVGGGAGERRESDVRVRG